MSSLRLFVFSTLIVFSLLLQSAHAVTVDRVVSQGGIEAWLVRDSSNPIITVDIAFEGGAVMDPAGKEGLANLVSGLIDEGSADLDSLTFQRTLLDLSIRLSFDSGKESFSGSLKTLRKNRDRAFELLGQALSQPRFDDEPVGRIRSQILAGIRQNTQNPNRIASSDLFGRLFPDHPYGRPSKGTVESVSNISTEDMRQFVKSRFAKDNLTIGVVGDITVAELQTLLDKTFASLPAKSIPVTTPPITPVTDGSLSVIEHNAPQSAVLFSDIGLKRADPDFYAATVMNHIFGGGGFTSRLYSEIREKRGLVYSVYSRLSPYDQSALLVGRAGTANARVGETLSVLREQWKLMSEKGISESELEDAKTYLTGSFPLRFTSSGTIASILVGMQQYNLGIDYLDRRNALVEAVTREDVNRLAKKLLDPKRLTITVVGKPEGVVSTN